MPEDDKQINPDTASPVAPCAARSDAPEIDAYCGQQHPDTVYMVPADLARRLVRERDEARNILAKWLEWARMHGHLDHAAGVANYTREILDANAEGDARRETHPKPTDG